MFIPFVYFKNEHKGIGIKTKQDLLDLDKHSEKRTPEYRINRIVEGLRELSFKRQESVHSIVWGKILKSEETPVVNESGSFQYISASPTLSK